jgi:hypothetical protein
MAWSRKAAQIIGKIMKRLNKDITYLMVSPYYSICGILGLPVVFHRLTSLTEYHQPDGMERAGQLKHVISDRRWKSIIIP